MTAIWNDLPAEEWDKQCWAIVANNNGQGCVLAYGGGASLRFEIEEHGCMALDDLGIDDAPNGLSVWEGRFETTVGESVFGYCDDSIEVAPRGKFRALRDEELARLRKSNREPIRHSKEPAP